ncbi:MAG: hypothetical protein OXI27_07015 [Thaumarchaeota archaeon]|nr:hypothetical protein [Nitrososphaerota archaeon]
MLKGILLIATATLVLACGYVEESLGLHYFDKECTWGYCNESAHYGHVGVAVNDEHVFIVDDGGHIIVTDLNGKYVKTIDVPGSANGIAVGSNRVFVSDQQNNMVRIFDPNGTQVGFIGAEFPYHVNGSYYRTYIGEWGAMGQDLGPREFATPSHMATYGNVLFVAEEYFGKVKIFDLNGAYMGQFDTFNKGDGHSAYGDPLGLAANSTHVFIADNWMEEVHITDMRGNLMKTFGVGGVATIAVNDKNIFTSSTGDMVRIYKLDGTYVTALRGCNPHDGSLDEPLNITYIDLQALLDRPTFGSSYSITVEPMGLAVRDNHLIVVNRHDDARVIFDPTCIDTTSNTTSRSEVGYAQRNLHDQVVKWLCAWLKIYI